MNASETARLLGAMAAFDRRTVGDADVIAWQAVLDDIPFADALEAVKRHYREGEAWLMPVHVRRSVEQMRRERERAANCTGWAPGQYGVPREEAAPELTDRVPRDDELGGTIAELLGELRSRLRPGSREGLAPRREFWAREHAAYRRQQTAEPNPYYRPGPHSAPLAGDSGARLPYECPSCGDIVRYGFHVATGRTACVVSA